MDPADNDPDMALEIAVRNLDIKESSDSEAEEAAAGGNGRSDGQLLEEEEQEESRVPTLDRMARLYSPSPAPPSAAQSVLSGSGISPPPRHQLTLTNVFEDDKIFSSFRRFLKDQCIMRNLNFWLTCEHFRKEARSQQSHRFLYDMAKAIYVKFIKGSATQRVTLMDQTRKNIKTSLEQQRFSLFLFDSAQQEIWDVMVKNELRQFLVSGMSADCSSFLGPDNVSVLSSVYTPSMANPIINVCGGGSLLHSESEDSASLSSFATESEVGPRSLVIQLSQSIPSGRNAISDCEEVGAKSHSRRSGRGHAASDTYLTKDKQVSRDRFAALVQERLHAVQKDREGMTKRVREIARQQKKAYNEIMALEWFDLPEAFRYQQYSPNEAGQSVVLPKERGNQIQAPYSKHLLSPLLTPTSLTDHKQKDLGHIHALAYREVLAALKDMNITNQVNESRRPFSRTSGCSSVLSTTSDSGVGDTLATSGLVTPQQERLAAFVHRQKTLTNSIPERERDARAAAISLISNSPQPESLNPRVSSSIRHHPPEKHRKYVGNYPEAYSSDDNSSNFTVTSLSSTSDLFIPRRQPPRPAYSDNDDTHHYGSSRYPHRRQLSIPRRTKQPPNPVVAPPSPIVEHQISNQLTTPTNTRVTPQRDTLVVYHFDDVSTPFAKKVTGSCLSLGEFKHKVLKRPGDFRYFFKSFCEDLGMEILEEYCEDSAPLPLIQGKIIGRVERS